MALTDRFKRRGERVAEDPTSANIDLLGGDDNLFAESVDAGHRIDPRAQKIFLACVVLVVVYAIGLVFPKYILNVGVRLTTTFVESGHYSLSQFVGDLQANFAALMAVFFDPESEEGVMCLSNMIRYAVIALAGAGLAVSGAVYQGAFRNALVSPSTLGVMSGGSFGMMLWVVVAGGIAAANGTHVSVAAPTGAEGSFAEYLNTSMGLALCSFAGCLLVVGLVLVTMRLAGAQKMSGIMLIITGQVIGGIIGVVGTTVRYYYATMDPFGDVAMLLQELQVATFVRKFTFIDVVALGVPLAIVFFAIMRIRQKMMLLAFDTAEQRTMGVDARKMQIIVVGLCTLLTAIIISFCGMVGFVGFLVPHLSRRLVGPNFKYLLPASLVVGAIFVLSAYLLVEITFGTVEMTGMYISIAGSAIFLATALRGKGVSYGAFR